MDEFNPGMGLNFTGTYSNSPLTQTSAFQFSQYLTPSLLGDTTARGSTLLGEPTDYASGAIGLQETSHEDLLQGRFPGDIYPSPNVTRERYWR